MRASSSTLSDDSSPILMEIFPDLRMFVCDRSITRPKEEEAEVVHCVLYAAVCYVCRVLVCANVCYMLFCVLCSVCCVCCVLCAVCRV